MRGGVPLPIPTCSTPSASRSSAPLSGRPHGDDDNVVVRSECRQCRWLGVRSVDMVPTDDLIVDLCINGSVDYPENISSCSIRRVRQPQNSLILMGHAVVVCLARRGVEIYYFQHPMQHFLPIVASPATDRMISSKSVLVRTCSVYDRTENKIRKHRRASSSTIKYVT